MSDNKPAMITGLIDDWKLRSAEVKVHLRLKYLPLDFDFGQIDECERYLEMSDDQQRAFVSDMNNEEYEFWNALETSRALYVNPLDKQDGSITEAKVAAHPKRYGWKL
ncbi:hypothetical protein [Agrobacterium sp. B1(2019)]|uniref:hypothetical protein n=1 Tax=Agrobacterium sp. B1(2019) TaxID=2607032 RepID=UPI0011EF81C5|nr:hypothetical protein [Agrobacterium sp. B1(2019)]TZG36614.1 hypothetical protein AGR1_03710 [Agrobacterium sp. B1(2019)]